MDATDILTVLQHLESAYPAFHMTPFLADMWANELATVAAADLQEAFRRYVLDNQPTYPPTLNRLLDLAETVRRERRAQDLVQHQEALDALALPTVLANAAERMSESNRTWAREHVAMFLAGVSKPGRAADAIAWCTKKAQEFPADAVDWIAEARTYQQELNAAAEDDRRQS